MNYKSLLKLFVLSSLFHTSFAYCGPEIGHCYFIKSETGAFLNSELNFLATQPKLRLCTEQTPDHKTLLKAERGYLSAFRDGRFRLMENPKTWETFQISDAETGSVSVQSFHNTYLAASPTDHTLIQNKEVPAAGQRLFFVEEHTPHPSLEVAITFKQKMVCLSLTRQPISTHFL